MRKLDLATIGPPEYCKFRGKLLKLTWRLQLSLQEIIHFFLGGGVCSGIDVLLLA